MKRLTWQPGNDGRRLLVPPPLITETQQGTEYSFSIWMERRRGSPFLLQTVSYSFDVPLRPMPDPGTAALASVLMPAMRMGLPVRIEAPVSPQFLEKTGDFQDVFSTLVEGLQRVEIAAPAAAMTSPPADDLRGTGSFFSLGVDGFDTLRRHAEEVSDLVFIHGFDIDLDKHAHRAAVQDAVSAAAQSMDKRLITVQTNARSFSDAYLWWGHYSGFVLGAVSHLLAGQLRNIYLASGSSYNTMIVLGTNALTDPWFSTEAVEVFHDGTEFSRMDKVMALARDDFALQHLRVCWEMEGTAKNCGRCDKCLRTMTALFLAGALEQAPTFPSHLDIEAVRKMRLMPAHLRFYDELMDKARELGLEHSPLMKAWEECALRSGAAGSGRLDQALLSSLTKQERDQLFDDLFVHAPDELGKAAAAYAPRMRGEVFDFLWRQHRPALWRAIRKGRV